ncbi:hypothetical protein SKUN_001745 (plasmid) [Spiroplasma kunkelii CR2-3x]|uniref:Uncharacterized protein n=1 Tax=Spiroplasma kunkelii CR2-3x TaxID=273035 RepID=A0A0K2JJZ9_SPIKU|nr:hypothetical protein [Spiroplasma kunkelii]ALA98596.1 hypothetical protein SKUN_001745 [Spiroplasma kunkelii CR2-3x]
MKKLLSILTITGAAMPNVIAVSSYQKQQKKEYSQDKINYEFFLNEPNKIFFTFSEKRWKEIKDNEIELYNNHIRNKYLMNLIVTYNFLIFYLVFNNQILRNNIANVRFLF